MALEERFEPLFVYPIVNLDSRFSFEMNEQIITVYSISTELKIVNHSKGLLYVTKKVESVHREQLSVRSNFDNDLEIFDVEAAVFKGRLQFLRGKVS